MILVDYFELFLLVTVLVLRLVLLDHFNVVVGDDGRFSGGGILLILILVFFL